MMRTARLVGLSHCLRQVSSVFGIVSLSVLATLLVQHVLAAPSATAQPSQPQEVRAARFVLVGPDGTELATLEPGRDGNGRLQLFDAAGTLRVGLAAQGALNIFDTDGTTQRFRAGYVPYADAFGRPPINGVWLDANGSVSIVPSPR
jgi:hypothetical protein